MIRILVTGGRDYADRAFVFRTLDIVHNKIGIALIIHGACCDKHNPIELQGADRWAQEWAQHREVPYVGVPAPWRIHDRAAGPIRNRIMRDDWDPGGVIAFPGGSGTENMVRVAREGGLKIWDLRAAATPSPSPPDRS